ncbi:glycosyltransferase [Agarivorans aestuarii]|uniref:glycosyltransferase n=1 Tax=Agarivorans aestuarii TaxID=1563703 RepID=UPI001C8013C3|nr:glycosyltransferase [Agarivorans aestuarii]
MSEFPYTSFFLVGQASSSPENEVLLDRVKKLELKYKSRFQRFLLQPYILYRILRFNADIYHLHNPDTIFIAMVLKLLRKKVIYDTHEDFSRKVLVRGWVPQALRRPLSFLVSSLELFLHNVCDGFIVTQKSQEKKFCSSTLIDNAPLVATQKVASRALDDNSKIIKLIFIGGISEDRGLGNMLKLTEKMNRRHPTKLTLIGPVINGLSVSDLQRELVGNRAVSYLGVLEQERAFDILKQSHLGLILFNDVADYADICPNKIFEYLSCGVPFVASDFDVWKSYFDDRELGVFFDVNKELDSLAQSLIELFTNRDKYNAFKQDSLDFVRNTYNWHSSEEHKLFALYQRVMEK